MTRHAAVILGGPLTPIGRYGGSLSHIRSDGSLGLALNAAVERVGIERGDVEEIAAGCVNPAHEGRGDIARWAALKRRLPRSARPKSSPTSVRFRVPTSAPLPSAPTANGAVARDRGRLTK